MGTKKQIETEFEAERTTIPPEEPKRRRGRPETRVLKIDATPEEVAKCLVTPVKDWKRPPSFPIETEPQED